MPKNNNQEQIPLIEQPEQISSYHSINSSSATTSRKNHYSDNSCNASSHFFIQQFKKDFPLNDFSGSNSLNTFKF
ncbi:hypothetical protein [Candidatus Rickettsiella viridis]|uniref:hypothetical protein n=1 Tax=Candidatus Rickettsiella viridis TaxID=676208 RepID=UPI000F838BA7|nr:hypothetical protein [Candidatus Rickettsiella viridis]